MPRRQREPKTSLGPTLVILAAGAGSRYGGLKQLAPVGPNGEALLEYSVFDALEAGFERIVLVVRPETEATFRERLDPRLAARAPVTYVHQSRNGESAVSLERSKPWGTGHAVLALLGEVTGPFGVINADDFYGRESHEVLSEFLTGLRHGSGSQQRRGRGHRLAAVGFPLAETLTDTGAVSRAVLDVDAEGKLSSIAEFFQIQRRDGRIMGRDGEGRGRTFTGEERVSMNMWGIVPDLLLELRAEFAEFLNRSAGDSEAEFLLPAVIQTLVRRQRFEVEILPGGGDWCGITFREDEAQVRATIESSIAGGRYPRQLWR